MKSRWSQALIAPVLLFFSLFAAAQVPQPPRWQPAATC
jgi:hypothetical protein